MAVDACQNCHHGLRRRVHGYASYTGQVYGSGSDSCGLQYRVEGMTDWTLYVCVGGGAKYVLE